jgi:hypothetical protein
MRWLLAAFMALVTGLLFLQLPVSFEGGISLMGMLFQGLFFVQVPVGGVGGALLHVSAGPGVGPDSRPSWAACLTLVA